MDTEFTLRPTSKANTSNTMYRLFLLAALLACVAAAPRPGPDAQITKFNTQADTDGSYSYEIENSENTVVSEQGQGAVYAKGFYRYDSPEGIPVQLSYVADENGFQPQSDLLPTPPPIPDYILRSIEFIRQHPTPEEVLDREVRARQI
ncbi:pupal cuticle protein Edg-78E [Drosophila novamexicana]|uniref:pupal cuticle protein Edg-78E n=1 Tax=Drosophila novamexicana TaxID=47314 RepID=UPI0011E5D07D|nr:pupal cuticle protein Edg-78E [Drosophila novamexicana]